MVVSGLFSPCVQNSLTSQTLSCISLDSQTPNRYAGKESGVHRAPISFPPPESGGAYFLVGYCK